MMLGPCRGGAVRLGDPTDVLMIGEGIETCLAAMAGDRQSDVGGTLHLRLADPRSTERGAQCDRAGRWRRRGRSSGTGLCLALDSRRPARAHRQTAKGHGFQ